MVKLEDGTTVRLKNWIWDTAGSEAFKSISNLYFRDADVAVFCYSVDNRQSVKQL